MTTAETIEATLRDTELDYERQGPHAFVVNLPGTRRLKTACWLTIGEHALSVEAFVMRKPDENCEQVYRYLLEHNARMYGVAWSIDDSGDVYLSGRVALASISAEEIDRLLGAVLEYADTMTRDVVVPQAVFDKVRAHFDEEEMVELTVTVGFYHLVSRFIVAMEL